MSDAKHLIVNLRQMAYSPSHIVQKTNFLDFLHEYRKDKSETFTEFWTNFVLTTNIKIIRWCAVVAKKQQIITYDHDDRLRTNPNLITRGVDYFASFIEIHRNRSEIIVIHW